MPSSISSRSNGQTILQTWFNILKEWIEDIDTRLNLEKVDTIDLEVLGEYALFGNAETNVLTYVVRKAVILTGARLYVFTNGTGSYLEVDLKKSTDGSSFSTVFTTKPRVGGTTGDNHHSDAAGSGDVAAVLDSSTTTIAAGTFLRVDLTNVPSGGNPLGFLLSIAIRTTGV